MTCDWEEVAVIFLQYYPGKITTKWNLQVSLQDTSTPATQNLLNVEFKKHGQGDRITL